MCLSCDPTAAHSAHITPGTLPCRGHVPCQLLQAGRHLHLAELLVTRTQEKTLPREEPRLSHQNYRVGGGELQAARIGAPFPPRPLRGAGTPQGALVSVLSERRFLCGRDINGHVDPQAPGVEHVVAGRLERPLPHTQQASNKR